MCEDAPPIKALTFLQTKVSSVVDHGDAEETATFRSLLSHLLAVPSGPSVGASSTDGALPHAARVLSQGSNACLPGSSDARPLITFEEDQVETGMHTGSPVAPARFTQRTAMFERLLKFVNDDAKEPENDLLDIIPMDGLLVR